MRENGGCKEHLKGCAKTLIANYYTKKNIASFFEYLVSCWIFQICQVLLGHAVYYELKMESGFSCLNEDFLLHENKQRDNTKNDSFL